MWTHPILTNTQKMQFQWSSYITECTYSGVATCIWCVCAIQLLIGSWAGHLARSLLFLAQYNLIMQSLCFLKLSSSLHLLSEAVTWEVFAFAEVSCRGSKRMREKKRKEKNKKNRVINQAPFPTMFFWVEFFLGQSGAYFFNYGWLCSIVINGIWLLADYHASVAALPDCHGQKESKRCGSNSKSNIHYV